MTYLTIISIYLAILEIKGQTNKTIDIGTEIDKGNS